jgi:hypothetical protein
MKYAYVWVALSLFLLPQCKSTVQSTAEQEQAWDEMMVIHDEVMPRLKNISDLSGTISKVLSSGNLPDHLRTEAEQINQQLLNAEKEMWDWMYALRQLPDLRQQASHQEIMAYLDTETNNIRAVNKAILSSIASAEAFINTNNTQQ